MGALWLSYYDAFEKSDGMLIMTPEAYEPAAVAATKEWFAESKRPVWAVGPLISSVTTRNEGTMSGKDVRSESVDTVTKFMDDTLATHGERTMIYISFGSTFWPSNFEKAEAFIDVLIEKRIPFIFSHGPVVAQLTEAFKEKVEKSSVGLLSRSAPQQTILLHPPPRYQAGSSPMPDTTAPSKPYPPVSP
ncbi:hypothetical protein BXZ70DRAFT_561619 [Cristinia sonorae]|uniref:Uncharacterized protein n=1 Tax=Cristinia sonorae TaxID=1940300 RepID=A0A8K0XKZ9_9AGAR|nr:hypothetical protein BXZ70DRAFT_561619 [Cristinia sonorae]